MCSPVCTWIPIRWIKDAKILFIFVPFLWFFFMHLTENLEAINQKRVFLSQNQPSPAEYDSQLRFHPTQSFGIFIASTLASVEQTVSFCHVMSDNLYIYFCFSRVPPTLQKGEKTKKHTVSVKKGHCAVNTNSKFSTHHHRWIQYWFKQDRRVMNHAPPVATSQSAHS